MLRAQLVLRVQLVRLDKQAPPVRRVIRDQLDPLVRQAPLVRLDPLVQLVPVGVLDYKTY